MRNNIYKEGTRLLCTKHFYMEDGELAFKANTIYTVHIGTYHDGEKAMWMHDEMDVSEHYMDAEDFEGHFVVFE